MDTKVRIDYSNYSIEELTKLQSELSDLIDRKRTAIYDAAINNILNELAKMAKDYPYEDALDDDDNGIITWKELYDAIRDFHC